MANVVRFSTQAETSGRVQQGEGECLSTMMLLSHALFAAVTCPDTKSLPLPASPLTNTCDSGAAIFTPANLNGDADVLTIYNGVLCHAAS